MESYACAAVAQLAARRSPSPKVVTSILTHRLGPPGNPEGAASLFAERKIEQCNASALPPGPGAGETKSGRSGGAPPHPTPPLEALFGRPLAVRHRIPSGGHPSEQFETMRRRLACPRRKDDTHKSIGVTILPRPTAWGRAPGEGGAAGGAQGCQRRRRSRRAPKGSEGLRRIPKDSEGFRRASKGSERFPKRFRRVPKCSEGDPKDSEGLRSGSEGTPKVSEGLRRVPKASEGSKGPERHRRVPRSSEVCRRVRGVRGIPKRSEGVRRIPQGSEGLPRDSEGLRRGPKGPDGLQGSEDLRRVLKPSEGFRWVPKGPRSAPRGEVRIFRNPR